MDLPVGPVSEHPVFWGGRGPLDWGQSVLVICALQIFDVASHENGCGTPNPQSQPIRGRSQTGVERVPLWTQAPGGLKEATAAGPAHAVNRGPPRGLFLHF